MLLSAAAAFFDRTLCADAYTPATTFYGQLDVYDDSRRDGATVVRRILSLDPSVSLPARRVLTIHDEQWLVGMAEIDSFSGDVIRRKYVLHAADGECLIQTPGEALSSGGSSSYGSRLWVKDTKAQEVTSELDGFYNLYLPSSETVSSGQVLTLSSRLHLVRNVFVSAAGFLVAEVDELESDALVAATYTPRVYTPSTDTHTDGTPVVTSVIKVRYQSDFEYAAESAKKFVAGDVKALVRAAALAAAPRPNDTVTLPDGVWYVIDSAAQSDCYGLHLRRAGT